MADLTVHSTVRTGTDPASASAAADVGGTDKFLNTGEELLLITNGSGSSYTATFPAFNAPDGLSVSARTVTIPAGHAKLIGPFPGTVYNDPQKKVNIQHSATTSISLLAFKKGS